jgi:hypothetical protein
MGILPQDLCKFCYPGLVRHGGWPILAHVEAIDPSRERQAMNGYLIEDE